MKFQVLLAACTCAMHCTSALLPEREPPPLPGALLQHTQQSGFWNLAQTVKAPLFTCRLSGTVILYNKYILAYYGFPFPIALTMWHMTFSGVLAFLLVRLGYVGVRIRACCASLATSCSAWGLAASMLTSQRNSRAPSSSVAHEGHLLPPLPVLDTPDSGLLWHPLSGRLPYCRLRQAGSAAGM